MVGVEPVSLSIGIAALFTSCIECFEYFKAGQNLRRDYDILLLKLEIEQERLLVWGEVEGIEGDEWVNKNTGTGNNNKPQDLTWRCLDTIENLLGDAESLKSTYGVKPTSDVTEMFGHHSLSSSALKRLRIRLGRNPSKLSALDRTRWAIHDAAKFEKLVTNVRDLVDRLLSDMHRPQSTHDERIQIDIASLADDVASLQLLEEACGDSYPIWSDYARSAVAASEIGTVDGDTNSERLKPHTRNNAKDARFDLSTLGRGQLYVDSKLQFFFVLTEQCRNEGTESPCEQTSLASKCFSHKHCFVPSGSISTGSSPGQWIAKELKPQDWTGIDLEESVQADSALRMYAIKDGEFPARTQQFTIKSYIYCPPCACQLATALHIGRATRDFRHMDVCIRVDCCLLTQCSTSSSRIEGIVSLIEYIKEAEREEPFAMTLGKIEQMRLIDRQWLEQLVYNYDEEVQATLPSHDYQMSSIIHSHIDESLCASIIVLGEADYCIPMLSLPPFPPFKRGISPKETQLYGFQQHGYARSDSLWQRRFLGTYTGRKRPAKNRPQTGGLDTRNDDDSVESQAKRKKLSDSQESSTHQRHGDS